MNENINQNVEQVEKKPKRHGLRSICALALALVLLITGSLAYFTDYAMTQTSGTAGTLAIELNSNINLLNEDGMDILNPGDKRNVDFCVINKGNKSADVKTTIVLTAYDRNGNPIDLGGTTYTQSIYDLYWSEDVNYDEGRGWAPIGGVEPVQVKEINGNQITYILPELSLDGNSDLYDEYETIERDNMSGYAIGDAVVPPSSDEEEESEPIFRACRNLVLIFDRNAGNEWQASSIKLDVIVEAKQHENTEAGWEIVAKKEVTSGEITKDVVLEEVVITPITPIARPDENEPTLPEEPVADDIFVRFFYPFAGEDEQYLFEGEMSINIIDTATGTIIFSGIVDTGEDDYFTLSSANIPNGEYEFAFTDYRSQYKQSFPLEITGPGTYEVELWTT